MKLTFLKATTPLTKSFTKTATGEISKSSYPNVYEVTSIEEECADLPMLAKLLTKHAALGHCLVKGTPTRSLVHESRAGTTDSSATTEWVVFDVDGIPCKDAAEFMSLINLGNLSYVVQYSASYRITSDELRCHIYARLDRPIAAPLIKQWLIQLNHQIKKLHDAMQLTKTGNAILWPLDITACQNDKLLYIAPPILKGVKDPFAKTGRIHYVEGSNQTLILPTINTTAQNKTLTNKRINDLRITAGYEPRKTTYRMLGGTEVMVKPDACDVTDMKVERGFVYFNINGGDSWGYYHPEDNPEYIRNFKGEPVYATKELLPEYWHQLTQQASAVRSDGITYLAFCDRKTGSYWRGTYDAATNELDIYHAKNETQIRHFAKQHGMPLGDYIPEWDLMFDPTDTVRVDADNRTVNTFQPSKYMQAVAKQVTTCPKLVFKVIHHVLGGDMAITEHFINWLAYILQYRTRSCTSWVMHGRTGTGKGVLFHKILRPIFGANQTAFRSMENLDEKYNDYVQNALIVFIDEVEAKAMTNERGVMAKLRTYVTEETVPIRAMHIGSHEIENYSNWIFSSNKSEPVAITKDDRRTNVGKYQSEKLDFTDADLPTLEKELQAFHDYLQGYAVSVEAAKTPIATADRDTMISISESSVDTVGSALLEGNFEFFVDQMPTTKAYERNMLEANKVADYLEVLKNLIDRTDAETGVCNVSRDELRTMFEYVVGGMPNTPNKFTSLLKHHRIHTVKVRVNSSTPYGMRVVWKDVAQFQAYHDTLSPRPAAPAKLKVAK